MKLIAMLCWVFVVVGAAACVGGREKQAAPTRSRRLPGLAAASLGEAFREVGAAFEASHPGVRVEFSFAGSNQLRMQLESGACYVFDGHDGHSA